MTKDKQVPPGGTDISLYLRQPLRQRIVIRCLMFLVMLTVWIRLRRNGWTLKKLDSHIAEERDDWYPGCARYILLHPLKVNLTETCSLLVYCHGFTGVEQIEENFWGFMGDLVLPVYLYRRSRIVRFLHRIFHLPTRIFISGLRRVRPRAWFILLLVLALLLILGWTG